jgi:hypothetical protein
VALTHLRPSRNITAHRTDNQSLAPTHHPLRLTPPTRVTCTCSCSCASGGAYLGFYHIGVVKALFLEGLLPRVVRCVTLLFLLSLSVSLSLSQCFPVYVTLLLPPSPFLPVAFFLPHFRAMYFNSYFKISPVFLSISFFVTPSPYFLNHISSFSSLSLYLSHTQRCLCWVSRGGHGGHEERR